MEGTFPSGALNSPLTGRSQFRFPNDDSSHFKSAGSSMLWPTDDSQVSAHFSFVALRDEWDDGTPRDNLHVTLLDLLSHLVSRLVGETFIYCAFSRDHNAGFRPSSHDIAAMGRRPLSRRQRARRPRISAKRRRCSAHHATRRCLESVAFRIGRHTRILWREKALFTLWDVGRRKTEDGTKTERRTQTGEDGLRRTQTEDGRRKTGRRKTGEKTGTHAHLV